MLSMESIRTNDTSTKELYLTDKPYKYFGSVSAFLTALESNSTLERIYLGGDFLDGLMKKDIHAILETVGKVSSIKEVCLWSSSIEIYSLNTLIKNATGLEVLELGSVTLTGNRVDFDAFSNAVSKLSSLRELSLLGFKFGGSTRLTRFVSLKNLAHKDSRLDDNEIQLSSLLKALPSAKKLAAFRLAANSAQNMSLSSSDLMKVLAMPTLRELHLSRFTLGRTHIGVISWAIERGSLKVLALPATDFEDVAASRLAASLGQSNLESLDLSHNDELTNEGASLIAESLLGNQHLKVLRLSGCQSIGAAGLEALSQVAADEKSALEHVQAPSVVLLKRLGMAGGKPSQLAYMRATAA